MHVVLFLLFSVFFLLFGSLIGPDLGDRFYQVSYNPAFCGSRTCVHSFARLYEAPLSVRGDPPKGNFRMKYKKEMEESYVLYALLCILYVLCVLSCVLYVLHVLYVCIIRIIVLWYYNIAAAECIAPCCCRLLGAIHSAAAAGSWLLAAGCWLLVLLLLLQAAAVGCRCSSLQAAGCCRLQAPRVRILGTLPLGEVRTACPHM